MKSITRHIAIIIAAIAAGTGLASGQMLKLNAPLTLGGSPNLGYEHQLNHRLALSGDVFWLPYMSDKHEEVFRSLQITSELRYYFRETLDSRMASGWYMGGYLMYGDFNIGLYRHNDMDKSFRRAGWGVSGGVSGGWKYKFNDRWQMDINLGVGYVHMRYHKYKLGGAYRHRPIGGWRSSRWIGPTRFSISFGYVLNCGCRK